MKASQTINKILVLGMMFQAISSGRVHANPDSTQPEVLVRLFDTGGVAGMALPQSEYVATQILASAGVRVRWTVSTEARHPASLTADCDTAAAVESIDLVFAYSVPAGYKPGALAEALPFADCGVRITVFFNRLSRVFAARLAPDSTVLGHVLAHEIGHVLLKLESHSETGLMKARWTDYDFVRMRCKLLAFTPEAIRTIQSNLAKQQSGLALVSRIF